MFHSPNLPMKCYIETKTLCAEESYNKEFPTF